MTLEHTDTLHALSSLSRVRLLFILQQDGSERSIDELADAVGLHHNTVREHLQVLADAGFVLTRSEHRASRGRPRVLYSARTGDENTTDPIAARTLEAARVRAALLRRYLATGEDVDLTGYAGPQAEVQLDLLEDHLDQSGFDSIVDRSTLVVDLLTCPLMAMVEENRDLVCSVHFGIMQTMVRMPDGPLLADTLEPLHTPDRCRLHLARTTAGRRERPIAEARMTVEHTPENALIITGQ